MQRRQIGAQNDPSIYVRNSTESGKAFFVEIWWEEAVRYASDCA
jgi:hypothetical protein